jgi:hypothetical protein
MTESEFLDLVDSNLYPAPYTESSDGPASVLRLLQLNSLGARYALVVARWSSRATGPEQVSALRSVLKKHLKARWPFSQVGIIAFFLGDQDDWHPQASSIHPDRHGLNPIILQGLVLLDPVAETAVVRRSEWGPLKFGNFQGQFSKVNDLLSSFDRPQ